MNATYKQIEYIRSLSKQLYGDEYEAQDRRGISRSMNLTQKLSKSDASRWIDELKAELAA